jgi:hypothetical protein
MESFIFKYISPPFSLPLYGSYSTSFILLLIVLNRVAIRKVIIPEEHCSLLKYDQFPFSIACRPSKV